MDEGNVVDRVRPLVEEVCREVGLELWELRFGGRGRRPTLAVTLDKEGGVSLADCEAFSERLSRALDLADPIPGPYFLDVASPGVERRLRHLGDVRRFAGERARLVVRGEGGRETLVGVLGGVEEGALLLRTEEGEERRIPWEAVEAAQLKPLYRKGDRR